MDGIEPMPLYAAAVMAVLLMGSGVLVVVVNLRAASGRLRVNHVAGLRTKATMRDAAAWRAAHRAAQGPMNLAGAGFVVGGIGVLPVFPPVVTLVSVLAACLWGVVWVLVAGVRGDRAARATPVEADPRAGRGDGGRGRDGRRHDGGRGNRPGWRAESGR